MQRSYLLIALGAVLLFVLGWALFSQVGQPVDDNRLLPAHGVADDGYVLTSESGAAYDVEWRLIPEAADNAFIAVSYDRASNTLTLTTAGGATVDCDLDADCPPPAPQTLYLARLDTQTPTEAAFTNSNNTIAVSATGNAPLALTLPAGTATPPGFNAVGGWVWLAFPDALAVISIESPGGFPTELCGSSVGAPDCTATTAITIGGQPYQALQIFANRLISTYSQTVNVTWTE